MRLGCQANWVCMSACILCGKVRGMHSMGLGGGVLYDCGCGVYWGVGL